MIGKKLWVGLLVIVVLLGGGILAFSMVQTPELKLAKAMGSLTNEDVVQVDSEYSMSIDFDFESNEEFLTQEEETILEIVKDLYKNIKGNTSVIVDKEKGIVEMDAKVGISGDVNGEEVNLLLPLRFYSDDEAKEIAFDSQPILEFLPELVDTIANNIIPNVPELEEGLSQFASGEDAGEWFANETKSVIMPVLEKNLKGSKIVIDEEQMKELEIESYLKARDEDTEYLSDFMLKKAVNYLKENAPDDVITEKDGWININLDENLMFDTIDYILEEIEADEEALKAFNDSYEVDITEAKQDLDELKEELEKGKLTLDLTVSYQIEKGYIVADKVKMAVSFEEDGNSFGISLDVNSTYSYGEDAAFKFHGEERTAFTVEDLEQMSLEFEEVFQSYFMQMMEAEMAMEFDEEDLTQEEQEFLELIELIESNQVNAEDFGISEEEFIEFLLELEEEGYLEPGTAAQYE